MPVGHYLLQLPRSCLGSQYLLVCVNNFSRFVVLAPVKNKTGTSFAHELVTHLLCPYTTLSDNDAAFRNAILTETCNQYNVTQTFTDANHPVSNGLVETNNKKILNALRPVVNSFFEHWEDRIPKKSICINSSVSESTGKTPHYIYGDNKRQPYMICFIDCRSPSKTLFT